jgi:S-adenosylmethionine:tRNA-ribosyltransferase-isomerase (queuine synthetase)
LGYENVDENTKLINCCLATAIARIPYHMLLAAGTAAGGAAAMNWSVKRPQAITNARDQRFRYRSVYSRARGGTELKASAGAHLEVQLLHVARSNLHDESLLCHFE